MVAVESGATMMEEMDLFHSISFLQYCVARIVQSTVKIGHKLSEKMLRCLHLNINVMEEVLEFTNDLMEDTLGNSSLQSRG